MLTREEINLKLRHIRSCAVSFCMTCADNRVQILAHHDEQAQRIAEAEAKCKEFEGVLKRTVVEGLEDAFAVKGLKGLVEALLGENEVADEQREKAEAQLERIVGPYRNKANRLAVLYTLDDHSYSETAHNTIRQIVAHLVRGDPTGIQGKPPECHHDWEMPCGKCGYMPKPSEAQGTMPPHICGYDCWCKLASEARPSEWAPATEFNEITARMIEESSRRCGCGHRLEGEGTPETTATQANISESGIPDEVPLSPTKEHPMVQRREHFETYWKHKAQVQ